MFLKLTEGVFKCQKKRVNTVNGYILAEQSRSYPISNFSYQPDHKYSISESSSETCISFELDTLQDPRAALRPAVLIYEAQRIAAQAGVYGKVTIATNMAGRGTDILLGGNPVFQYQL